MNFFHSAVNIDGLPQPFDEVKNHSRKEFLGRTKRHLTNDEWASHLNGLRSLNILSGQASEFEFKKNLTEGKTGIAKPDLIPSRSFDANRTGNNTPTGDKSNTTSPIKHQNAITSPKKAPATPKSEPKTSQPNANPNSICLNITMTKTTPSPNASPMVSPRGSRRTSPLRLVLEAENEHSIASNGDLSTKLTDEPRLNNRQQANGGTKEVLASASNGNNNNNVPSSPSDGSGDKYATLLSPPGSKRGGLHEAKPPNVLVYSESNVTRTNVLSTLKNLLNREKYAMMTWYLTDPYHIPFFIHTDTPSMN